jgi:hypothetical protein
VASVISVFAGSVVVSARAVLGSVFSATSTK